MDDTLVFMAAANVHNASSRSLGVRWLAPLALAVALLAAPAAEAATADSAKKAKKTKVKLRVESDDQRSLLESGRLEVHVRKTGKGKKTKVKLSAKQGKAKKLVRSKQVKARKKGKVKRLRLTDRGREVLGACGDQAVTVQGKYKRKGKRGKKKAKDSGRLAANQSRCPPPPLAPPPPPPPAAGCTDPIDMAHCLLPFPNDYYTVEDETSATGRRVALDTANMPANDSGKRIDAAPYNRNDGFSPGQPIVLEVPGFDNPDALAETDAVPINDLSRYTEADAPVVVIDAESGERWPIWVEIDSHATSPENTALMVHPATNFASGHRYVVALRDLRTAGGETIPAPDGFRHYRDDISSDDPAIEEQRGRFEGIFDTLDDAGIGREDLYLAWDFTVATDDNIAERILHMRDDAFAELGDTELDDLIVQGESPGFEVIDVDDFEDCGGAGDPCDEENEDPRMARQIFGTYTVPCYLEPSCAPGGRHQLGADGLPDRNGEWEANFECIVPRVAVDGDPDPVRPSLYGHGLFGSAGEVHAGVQKDLANVHGFILCATDEIGMSGADLPNLVANILPDLSNFPELADRLQQGLLNELFLGRTMIHEDGFASHEAFRVDGTLGTPSVIDTERLFYNGNSQGGIMGGALTAVAPDFERAALGVPAMRYSVLLPRSVDFDPFEALLIPRYPDPLDRALILSLVQMLWDRGEPNGYAHRMTDDPLPNTPPHEVLLNVAFGDHQVTNWAADVEARTIGASAHTPVLDLDRWPDVDVLWNVPPIATDPFDGSAIIYWDIGPIRPLDPDNPDGPTIGVGPPPFENIANRSGEDPHGAPRGAPDGLEQVSEFLQVGGEVPDLCDASPCYSGGWTGPPGP